MEKDFIWLRIREDKRMDRLPSELTDLIMQYAGPRATLSLASTSRDYKSRFDASRRALTRSFFRPRVIEEDYEGIKELYYSPWWNVLRLDTLFMPPSTTIDINHINLTIEGKINQQELDHPLLEGAVKMTILFAVLGETYHDRSGIYERECFFRRGRLNGPCKDHSGDIGILYHTSILYFLDGEMNGMQLLLYEDDLVHIFNVEDKRAIDVLELQEPPEQITNLVSSKFNEQTDVRGELKFFYDLYFDRVSVPEGPFSPPSTNNEGELIDYGAFTFRTRGHVIYLFISFKLIGISKIYTSYGTNDDESMFRMHPPTEDILSFFEYPVPYTFTSEHYLDLKGLEQNSSQYTSVEGAYGGEEIEIMPGINVYFLDAGANGYLATAIIIRGYEPIQNFYNPYQVRKTGSLQKVRDTFIPVRD